MYKILRISLLALLVLAYATATAQDENKTANPSPQKNALIVASDHEAFWLYIDEVQQNRESVKSIKIEGIPEGEHKLRVEINNEDHNVVGQNVLIKPLNNTFWVNQQRNMYGISLGKSVSQPEAIVPLVMSDQNRNPRPHKHYESTAEPRYRSDSPEQHYKPARPDRSKVSSHDNKDPMENNEFIVALENIMSRQYEAEKLSTAKQLIANNQLSINQIEQICQAFEYENNKLDFAKSAYNHCTEKGKYFQLMKIFQHESSKIELNEYITQQQQSEDNNQNEKNEKGNN